MMRVEFYIDTLLVWQTEVPTSQALPVPDDIFLLDGNDYWVTTRRWYNKTGCQTVVTIQLEKVHAEQNAVEETKGEN